MDKGESRVTKLQADNISGIQASPITEMATPKYAEALAVNKEPTLQRSQRGKDESALASLCVEGEKSCSQRSEMVS